MRTAGAVDRVRRKEEESKKRERGKEKKGRAGQGMGGRMAGIRNREGRR